MRLDGHLAPRPANHQPLTPVAFLIRAVESIPDRPAVVWNRRRWTYGAFSRLARRLADRLRQDGIGVGDVVSIMSPNRPELLAAHYAVPALGGVLNAINTRLDIDTVAYILEHGESRILLADPACLKVARRAASRAGVRVVALPGEGLTDRDDVIDVLTPATANDPYLEIDGVGDEWQALCLNYTSGTTGQPKGVVYHHRGAYLNALGNVMALGLDKTSAYLWTLPMFHCSGWCHTWAVTAAGAVHVCLEKPEPAAIFQAMETERITHFACAPVVLYMLLNHDRPTAPPPDHRIIVATGGAAPTTALIEALDALGIDVIHLYGLTESFGPVTLCEVPEDMEADAATRASFLARQGVSHVTANQVRIGDNNGEEVAPDGAAMGEIMLRGNTLMAGYYKDEAATEAAFSGGWFHTGDLAVRHSDGAIEIRDRAKDIVISGGENVSSLEVENVLHQHPSVLLAAVVAAPDAKWGEIACAFIELKPDCNGDGEELAAFCRERLAGFKVPKRFHFEELPKTATGKIQKFILRERAAAEAGRE